MGEALLVMVGGAVGSVTRYGIGLLTSQWFGAGFPAGTLVVNLVGSFLLGMIVALGSGLNLSPSLRLLLGTGFCGGFTTFSTFTVECLGLLLGGSYGAALLYITVSLGGGLLASACGFWLARAF